MKEVNNVFTSFLLSVVLRLLQAYLGTLYIFLLLATDRLFLRSRRAKLDDIFTWVVFCLCRQVQQVGK